MKKYYAVKNGRVPGVYLTWDECREQVSGYSGAVYKSFPSKKEAKNFVLGIQPPKTHGANADGKKTPDANNRKNQLATADFPDKPTAYVDGSYNAKTGEFSCGAVLLVDGKIRKFSQKFADEQLAAMHNVAGELKGAELAMNYCLENGISELDLYHDYEGIAAWAEGRWKTNKDGTREYKAFYDGIKQYLRVRFVKVKGHSGDKYNDMADELAKSALGLL